MSANPSSTAASWPCCSQPAPFPSSNAPVGETRPPPNRLRKNPGPSEARGFLSRSRREAAAVLQYSKVSQRRDRRKDACIATGGVVQHPAKSLSADSSSEVRREDLRADLRHCCPPEDSDDRNRSRIRGYLDCLLKFTCWTARSSETRHRWCQQYDRAPPSGRLTAAIA